MKLLALTLAGLLALIQYPLWLGKGGWLRVWELDRQVQAQQANNRRLAERNASLEGEVGDLRQGLLAVEERARYELGMVRADEVFIQFSDAGARRTPAADPAVAEEVRVARTTSRVTEVAKGPGR
jgi:cell division protein FtsB